MPLGVPFGRFRTLLSDIRIRRFQDAQTEMLDATQPLAQRQLAAFAQSPVPQLPQALGPQPIAAPPPLPQPTPPPFDNLQQLQNLAESPIFGPQQPPGPTPQQSFRALGQATLPSPITPPPRQDHLLTNLPGSLGRGVSQNEEVREEVAAQGSASEYAIAQGPDTATAMARVLEVNNLTVEAYDALNSEDRIFAIGQLSQLPAHEARASQSGINALLFRERPTKIRPLQALINVDRAGVEVGAAGITGARIAAEELIPGGGRPSLEAVREGGLGGAIERSEDVGFNIPERVPVVGGTRIKAAEIVNPINAIPLPVFDAAVAKLLAIPLRFLGKGATMPAAALRRLSTKAADKALDESLDDAMRATLRQFSRETDEAVARASVLTGAEQAEVRGLTGALDAAAELPTGLPSRADVAAPTADFALTRDAEGNIVGHTTLYHGTTEAGAKEIAERGFRPGEEVYLTGSPVEAQRFAGGAEGTVLRVELRPGAVGSPGGRFTSDDIIKISPVEPGAQIPTTQPAPQRLSTQEPPAFPEPELPAGAADAERFPGFEREVEFDVVQGVDAGLERQFSDVPEFRDATTISGRDFVGEELTRDSLPTTRDVQAWSKRIPPEERAAAAAEVADVKIPVEDFDVVVAREGTRYQTNIGTKLDDILQPLLGRNRADQVAVRNVFVSRDVYIARQGGRMRFAAQEWVGRSREALGLRTGNLDPLTGRVLTGPNKRGYALAVQMRAGAKIPKKAQQHLNDIIEHPEDYLITPEQRAALDEYEEITTNMLRAEQRHGVDVEELLEGYAPRIITKGPRGAGDVATRFNLKFPSTHPWYTKARAIPDIRQVFAAGFEVADPIVALEIRLSTGVESIANQRSVRALQQMGELSAKQVPEELRTALRSTRTAHIAARKQALKTGSVADRALAEQASVAFNQATEDVKRSARLLKQKRPKLFGRDVSPDVASEVAKFIQTDDQSAIDDIFRVMRTSLVQADYGSLMLQNASTFWRNNPAWLKAAYLGARSISDAPYDYLVRNADVIDIALKYGMVRQPEEFLLRRGGGIAQMVNALPVVRPSQNIFEWNVFVAQVERAKGVIRLAKNEEELLDFGAVLRKQSGSNFMPGLTTRQASIMGKLWFAPQFTTALLGVFVDPLRPVLSGVARREAIKTVGMMFGGAATMTVALNLAINKEPPNMTDPDKEGFWGIKVGKGHIFPFGPFQPFIVASARSARAANDIAHGRKPSARDAQAWPSFIANKASLPVRFASRLAEAMGVPIEDIRGGSFGRPEVVRPGESPLAAAKRELIDIAPIGPAQAIEGIRKGAPITGLEILGGRTTAQGAFRQLAEHVAAQRPGQETSDDIVLSIGRQMANAGDEEAQRLVREFEASGESRGTEGAARRGALAGSTAEAFERVGLRDTAIAALEGNMQASAQFGRDIDDVRRDRAIINQFQTRGVDFPDPTSDAGKLVDEFYGLDPEEFRNPETREIDYAAWRAARRAVLGKIRAEDEGLARTIDQRPISNPDDNPEIAQMERAYLAAKKLDNELNEMSPVLGLSATEFGEIRSFYRDVNRALDETAGAFPDREVSFTSAIQQVGRQQSRSESFIKWAVAVRSNSKTREQLTNPEFERFIFEHRAELEPFFPELFTRERLRDFGRIEAGVR